MSDFAIWVAKSLDTFVVRMIYIDMAGGDILAGLVLSDLAYWHLPGKNGKTKLRVQKAGHLWVAVRRSDWWSRTRMTPRQADRAIKVLVDLNLIEKRRFKFYGDPTVHLRILPETFLSVLNDCIRMPVPNPYLPVGESESSGPSEDTVPFPLEVSESQPIRELDITVRGIPVTKITTENTSVSESSESQRNSDKQSPLEIAADDISEEQHKELSRLIDRIGIKPKKSRERVVACLRLGHSISEMEGIWSDICEDSSYEDSSIRNRIGLFISSLPTDSIPKSQPSNGVALVIPVEPPAKVPEKVESLPEHQPTHPVPPTRQSIGLSVQDLLAPEPPITRTFDHFDWGESGPRLLPEIAWNAEPEESANQPFLKSGQTPKQIWKMVCQSLRHYVRVHTFEAIIASVVAFSAQDTTIVLATPDMELAAYLADEPHAHIVKCMTQLAGEKVKVNILRTPKSEIEDDADDESFLVPGE